MGRFNTAWMSKDDPRITDKNLKRLIKNAQGRLDRVFDKFGNGAVYKDDTNKWIKGKFGNRVSTEADGKIKIGTLNLENMSFRDRKDLWAMLQQTQGTLDIEYDFEKALKEDPTLSEMLYTEYGIDSEDMSPSEYKKAINIYHNIIGNISDVIKWYSNGNYQDEEIDRILTKSYKDYSELEEAVSLINNLKKGQKKKKNDIKNKGKIAHEEAIRDYYKNKYSK